MRWIIPAFAIALLPLWACETEDGVSGEIKVDDDGVEGEVRTD